MRSLQTQSKGAPTLQLIFLERRGYCVDIFLTQNRGCEAFKQIWPSPPALCCVWVGPASTPRIRARPCAPALHGGRKLRQVPGTMCFGSRGTTSSCVACWTSRPGADSSTWPQSRPLAELTSVHDVLFAVPPQHLAAFTHAVNGTSCLSPPTPVSARGDVAPVPCGTAGGASVPSAQQLALLGHMARASGPALIMWCRSFRGRGREHVKSRATCNTAVTLNEPATYQLPRPRRCRRPRRARTPMARLATSWAAAAAGAASCASL